MTDRELLELAAKAAGGIATDGLGECWDIENGVDWNPLTDDGDALRLAVKLEIDIDFGYPAKSVRCIYPAEPIGSPDSIEKFGLDPYAATRRAVVRAAAEIGKAMK